MKIKTIPSVPPLLILSGVLMLALILRLFAFTGIFGADDVSIALVAKDFLENGFSAPEGHYAQRIALILPLALIFKLFGTGDWQFAFMPMLASLSSIVLAYAMGRLIVSAGTGVLAALLLAVFPLDVANASLLFPDAIMGAYVALAIYLILRAEQAEYPVFLSFLAGIIIGVGWLVKVEAVLLLPVLGVYGLLDPGKRWRNVFFAGLGTFAVLAAEGGTYYFMAGDALRGAHAALNQGGGIANEEYGAGQLWVFPKAWFVSAYDFGLHYYLLFAAMAWVIVSKRKELYVLLAWLVIVLLWLQFGGNPFSSNYHVKSHLSRYCLTIAVPTTVLVAAMLNHFWLTGKTWFASIATGMTVLLGVFLIGFNTLAAEGVQATKLGLDYALEHRLFPLYMDKKSFDLAPWYLGDKLPPLAIYPIQQHHFPTQQTRLLPAEEIRGWVLNNSVFADYAWKRYSMRPVTEVVSKDHFVQVKSIDNPGSALAYAQARLMLVMLNLLPDHFLTNKARNTLTHLLDGGEVIIYQPRFLP